MLPEGAIRLPALCPKAKRQTNYSWITRRAVSPTSRVDDHRSMDGLHNIRFQGPSPSPLCQYGLPDCRFPNSWRSGHLSLWYPISLCSFMSAPLPHHTTMVLLETGIHQRAPLPVSFKYAISSQPFVAVYYEYVEATDGCGCSLSPTFIPTVAACPLTSSNFDDEILSLSAPHYHHTSE